MKRLSKLLAVIGLVTVTAAGCLGPGQGIADRIRAADSPLIQEVKLTPPNPLGGNGEHLYIYVVPETTQAQALALWCDVVLPAGAGQLAEVRLLKYPDNPISAFPYSYDPVCPDSGATQAAP